MADDFPIQPIFTTDGVPYCSYEACGSYDGKRCRATGARPDRICEPAVQDLSGGLVQLRARRDELLATIARISQSEPLPDEVQNALNRQGALLAEIGTLRSRVGELEQDLEMATGPHCSSCGNAIDPECCWCGDGPESKHFDETHGFIPMGCDCCRAERDWKKIASALRERIWALEHR